MTHFHPEMLDVLIANIQALIEQGTPPAEIVVLSPYLSDSLRFSIADRLEAAGIPLAQQSPVTLAARRTRQQILIDAFRTGTSALERPPAEIRCGACPDVHLKTPT
ncbi:MAG: hypothetical protein IPP55_02640 [Anaerolineales bacterium]|nr:hypothetical protein [Anaerolineales bacterium]